MGRPRSNIAPRIVHAARDRFLREGVDGASLRTIARDARTNIGMIYYYFPTKDDLFLAVVEEVYANLVADLEKTLGTNASVRERLDGLFRRIGTATDDELKVIRLMVREALVSSERLDKLLARFQRGHLGMMAQVIAEGISDGTIDASLPVPLAMLCTLAMGVVPNMVRRIAGDRPPFGMLPKGEEFTMLLADRLFSGIAPKR